MNIKFVSHKPQPEFEVYEEDKMLIHIKVDMETQAFRIKCKDERRVFFISEEVVKKNIVTNLLNEYSQQLGSLIEDKQHVEQGEINIEGLHYTYKLNDDFLKEINLSEQNSGKIILSCKLASGELSFLKKNYLHYILFGLAWFAFLAKQPETAIKLAEI